MSTVNKPVLIGGTAAAVVAGTAALWYLTKSTKNEQAVHGEQLFLGLDCSTQSLKGCIVSNRSAQLEVVWEDSLVFEEAFPQYKTTDGYIRVSELEVLAPTLMFVHALDVLLDRLHHSRPELIPNIKALSASGQQHGSVFWKAGALEKLSSLQANKGPMHVQLSQAFSVAESPIWMDSSTESECKQFEAELGGPQAVADATGSRAYERFTGNQIAKIMRTKPDQYEKTERISLVSSLVASLFLGNYASIDFSDGSGMNIMDLKSGQWSKPAIAAVEKIGSKGGLTGRLGPVAESHQVLGNVHDYFVKRYGFSRACQVVAASGDNPCTLAGLRLLEHGDVCVSLGTSTTVLAILSNPKPSGAEGHILRNPTDPASYMAMLCFKNGALSRDKVKGDQRSWADFSQLLSSTPAGNRGNIGFYYFDSEITPTINHTGVVRFNSKKELVSGKFSSEAQEIRAVVEQQCLAMRSHAESLQIEVKRILATGGASSNPQILQIISDVFGAPVFVSKTGPNTAALGAAFRALHGFKCSTAGKFVSFKDAIGSDFKQVASPDSKAVAVYNSLFPTFKELEKKATEILNGLYTFAFFKPDFSNSTDTEAALKRISAEG
jgi:xylulokinase